MGKASRRKKVDPSKLKNRVLRPEIPFVERPYEGIPREPELVAMREIIPCAVMTATTTKEHGAVEFDFVTMLPDGHPAMVRADRRILVGLQTRFASGDLSHDAAGALLAAIALEDKGGDGVVEFDVRDAAPRLQDVVDLDSIQPMEITQDFGFWLDPTQELDADTKAAIEQNREDVVPTEDVPGVEHAYWCEMNRNFVRYVSDAPEHQLFAALARLQVAGDNHMGDGSRFVGAFRACGIAIPVFELAEGASAADAAPGAKKFAQALAASLKKKDPLSSDERRARDGLVSRQVTIR